LILVAAGGLAREAAAAARAAGHPLRGFLDDAPARRGAAVDGLPVLGGTADAAGLLAGRPADRLVLCPGAGRARRALAGALSAAGIGDERYGTVVHPTASVAPSCQLGTGSILLAGVVLTASVTIGRHVAVMPNAVFTHDDVLADFVTVCAGATLAGSVRVAEGAYLGAGCLIREGRAVGAGATVGMGAVVLTDVPAGEVWAGNPARRLRAAARTSTG
jgi:sugar O-acyltransferase (sialic acid O-acetyltransferase NeuD family)